MKKFVLLKALALISVIGTSEQAIAGASSQLTCQVSDVQITSVTFLGPGGSEQAFNANASDCIAYEDRPLKLEKPSTNLGYEEDGWLNKKDYKGWWDGPGAFVDESDLLDLDNDQKADDPGWVMVGKQDMGNGAYFKGETISDGNTSYTFTDNLITFSDCFRYKGNGTKKTVDCNSSEAQGGDWTYTPPAMNPGNLLALLGGSFFDQVAFVFKAGPAFAMYNFTIEDLNIPPVLVGDFNFAFKGTWDISNVLGGAGLSNFVFWARDPETTEVPEPPVIALFLAGIAGLIYRKKAS